jgi:hypothetical protein
MRKRVGLLSIAGFFGMLAAANAQTASFTTAAAKFDGTYRLISSASVDLSYMSHSGQMGRCPYRRPGPLHIGGGRAYYTTGSGNRVEGKVGPLGELAMRSSTLGGSGTFGVDASGTIDGHGTARVLERGGECSYNIVWQNNRL